MIETTVLDFKLTNTFEEYRAHMEAPGQQAMFSEMGVKIFYLCLLDTSDAADDSLRVNLGGRRITKKKT